MNNARTVKFQTLQEDSEPVTEGPNTISVHESDEERKVSLLFSVKNTHMPPLDYFLALVPFPGLSAQNKNTILCMYASVDVNVYECVKNGWGHKGLIYLMCR